MSEKALKAYFELLSEKITDLYGISIEEASRAVQHSAIQTLIREEPEYVDHVPLSSWAEEIHEEMFTP